MKEQTRRELLTAAAVLPLAGALAANSDSSAPAARRFAPRLSGREVLRRRFFPDVVLTTHEGKQVRFYEDLLKDKIVVLNLMYANCQGVCPKITANLVKARALLPEAAREQVNFYAISIKPEEDTPEKLREYARTHGAENGWLFLTGSPADIELLRRKLGYVDRDPQVDRDKSRHSGMVRFGNEPRAQWAACQGRANPEWIAKEIAFVVPRAGSRRTESRL
jgi:protein SCO1/2